MSRIKRISILHGFSEKEFTPNQFTEIEFTFLRVGVLRMHTRLHWLIDINSTPLFHDTNETDCEASRNRRACIKLSTAWNFTVAGVQKATVD